jgi:CRP/FNR family transcriptional regulator, cyclic AMP receptor protein
MSDRDQLLASVPLFADLPKKTLERLDRIMTERTFPAGTDIVNAGEVGAGFFLITNGAVEVVSKEGQHLSNAKKGDYFGDMALLDGHPRSATVRATEPTTCLVMSRWDFMAEVRQNPDIALELLAEMSQRVRAAEARLAD